MIRLTSLIAFFVVTQSVLGAELRNARADECHLTFNDLNRPQPVLLRNGQFLEPSMPRGIILNRGENIQVACVGEGRFIKNLTTSHPDISIVNATCVSNDVVSVDDLGLARTQFVNLHCNDHPEVKIQVTEELCNNEYNITNVGYEVKNVFHSLYKICFNHISLQVFYVSLDQSSANFMNQLVIPEPEFIDAQENEHIARLYSLYEQRRRIAELVGDELTNTYINEENHLVPQRIAASHNFVFEFGQRATFFYINTAPYWRNSPMNVIGDQIQQRFINLDYTLYSGTHDILKLRNSNNQLVEVSLGIDSTLPVPLYTFFVAYEQSTKLGTAFICLNNPHMTEAERTDSVFCKDECLTNNKFDWLPFDSEITRCFCCSVDDFRSTVRTLPDFEVVGMLTGGSMTLITSRWLLGLLTYIVFKIM